MGAAASSYRACINRHRRRSRYKAVIFEHDKYAEHTVTAGANIRIDLVFTNISAHAIPVSKVVRSDEAELDYNIAVHDIPGNEPNETQWGRRLHRKDPMPAGDNASRISASWVLGKTVWSTCNCCASMADTTQSAGGALVGHPKSGRKQAASERCDG